MNDANEFLQTFGNASTADARELLRLIRQGAFARVLKQEGSWPSHHITAIYRKRVEALSERQQHGSPLYREYVALLDDLARTPEADCHLWSFESVNVTYAVVTVSSPQRIAGCMKRPGTPEHKLNATGNV